MAMGGAVWIEREDRADFVTDNDSRLFFNAQEAKKWANV